MSENIHLSLLKKERNIYEIADLYDQKRFSMGEMLAEIGSPIAAGASLHIDGQTLVCSATGTVFPVENGVVDFRGEEGKKQDEWARLNKRFMNYHRSLSLYTLINSVPLINYLKEKSGLDEIKNATIVDVGGGTGHTLCSFYKHPETLKYYNLDPNLRLLHDQFIRIYPDLHKLKMGHLLCYAEKLPFQSRTIDLVTSLSSIDHFRDYKAFMHEAFRILKPGGRLFIASHLEVPPSKRIQRVSAKGKLFSHSFWERLARYLYYKKYSVGTDDHTFHFETTDPIEEAMKEAGFSISGKEMFYGNFWIMGHRG